MIVTVLVGTGLLVFGLFAVPKTKSEAGRCRVVISDVYVKLAVEYEDSGKTIRELVKSQETNDLRTTIGRLIVELAKKNGVEVPKYFSGSLLHDPWGRPLNIGWKSDLLGKTNAPKLLASDGQILIWSSGRNGVNEFGEGDDIIRLGRGMSFPEDVRK